MSIQIIITADHVTDAISEIQTLATATGGEVTHKVELSHGVAENTNPVTREPQPVEEQVEAIETQDVEQSPKKLTRKEQHVVADKMVEEGEIDPETYELLTKKLQKDVEKRILDAAKEEQDENIFDEDVIDANTIRDMMGTLGRDKDGNPIQDNLLGIKEILTRFIPSGEDVKVGNIPQDQHQNVFNALKEIGG